MVARSACAPINSRVHRAALLLCIFLSTIMLCPTPGYPFPDSSALPLRICIAVSPLASIIEDIGGAHVTVKRSCRPGRPAPV